MAVATASSVTLKTADLRRAIAVCGPLCRPNSPKPILRCVLIAIGDGVCTVSASDLDSSAKASFACDGAEFTTVIPAEFISRVVGFSGESIELRESKNSIEFISDRSRWKTPTEKAEEFPVLSFDADCNLISVPSKWLAAAIRGTAHASDKAGKFAALAGVHFEFANGVFSLSAMDGVACCATEFPEEVSYPNLSGTVHNNGCKSILRCLAEEDGDVEVGLHKNDLHVHGGGSVVVSRLLEGRFPQWRTYIKPQKNMVPIPTAALKLAIEKASFVTTEEERSVKFSGKDGSLNVSSRTKRGETENEIPIAGELKTAHIDADYLLAFIRDSSNESLTFYTEADKPCLLESNGFKFAVMPIDKD